MGQSSRSAKDSPQTSKADSSTRNRLRRQPPLQARCIQTQRHSTRRAPRAYWSHSAIRYRFAPLVHSRLSSLRFCHPSGRTQGTSRQVNSISKKLLNINTGRDLPFYRATTLAFALPRLSRYFSGHCRLDPHIHLSIKIPP